MACFLHKMTSNLPWPSWDTRPLAFSNSGNEIGPTKLKSDCMKSRLNSKMVFNVEIDIINSKIVFNKKSRSNSGIVFNIKIEIEIKFKKCFNIEIEIKFKNSFQ